MDSEKLITFLIVLIIITLIGLSMGSGILVDESVAIVALDKQGFSEIKIVEKNWFLVGLRGCGNSDAAKFTAIAKNPRNETVDVFVCVGWPFKGATIRT